MRDLSLQQGIGTDPAYLNGNLVDGQTIVGEGINQDLVQFFQKLADLASIIPNDLPDNETNGYQLITALQTVIRSLVATTTLKGTVEKATNAEGLAGAADKFIDAAVLLYVISQKALETNPNELISIAIQTGAWNMDSTVGINVSYTPPAGKRVIDPSVTIFDDISYNCYPLNYNSGLPSSANPQGTVEYNAGSNRFEISRLTSGTFDNTSFDNATINRGIIIFKLINI